jgi:hypothetical protein
MERKGINIQDFLAKKGGIIARTKIEKSRKKIEKEVKPSKIYVKEKKEEIRQKTTPNTPILKKEKPFRFMNADSVRDPLKLLAFIEWLAMPPHDRELKTQKDFALKIGVNVDTLADWKKLLGFWDEVSVRRIQHFRKYTSSVYFGLKERAKTGDPKAVELFATLFEGFKKGMTIEDTTPERIITEEQKAEINRALKNIGLASIIKNNQETENDNPN